jgi:hypothetical protein
MTEELCHCGRPLHYRRVEDWEAVQRLVDTLGPTIRVTVDGRTWLVPRHYIALHGLRGDQVERLGFTEING